MRLLRGIDVGVEELPRRLLRSTTASPRARSCREPVDRHTGELAGRKTVREVQIRERGLGRNRLAARLADLDVALQRADDLEDVEDRARRHALAQCGDEELLAREAVEIRIGVSEADEVERFLAVELLVARLQVDLRVAVRTALRVQVPVVDVHVDPVQLVHEQLEAVEVDRDQVVRCNARESGNRRDRARGSAGRPRSVDAVDGAGRSVTAIDRNDEVTRKREERHRAALRICADEHDRVGTRGLSVLASAPLPLVVADHDRHCGLARALDLLELLRRLLRGLRVDLEGGQRLVPVEIRPAGEADHDDHERDPNQRKSQPTVCQAVLGGGGGTRYRRIGARVDGGKIARPLPLAEPLSTRPMPLLSVVRMQKRGRTPRASAAGG